MNFHLAHIVPNKTMHGLNGYKDVIDTVQWGLEQLGHTATYGLNSLSGTATNIVFGAQMLPMETVERLPPETIVYNFEQGKGWTADNIVPQIRAAARRLRIWDYSQANCAVWTALGATDIRVVPIGYSPILQRIGKAPVQDIDVLIYGAPGQERLGAFYYLCQSGLTCLFLCGMYGTARDELIARSKVVVNINLYDRSKIFEVVRVSYLLANRKAVVASVDLDTTIDDDIRAGIKATDGPQLVADCQFLVNNDAARTAQEEAGHRALQGRDIRKILERALADRQGPEESRPVG